MPPVHNPQLLASSITITADVTWVTADNYSISPPIGPWRTSQYYLDLIPAYNRGQPKFVATVEAETEVVVGVQDQVLQLVQDFDLDVAIGAQLDVDGEWIGRSRYISVPIPGLWFSFDGAYLGFDQGVWYQPQYDTPAGITRLDDDTYRILLRAKIAANHWDGTLPGARKALAILFPSASTEVFIIDNQDMTMTFAVSGQIPSPLFIALLSEGYVPLKPEGVQANYVITTVPGPVFGFDVQNSYISGFDTGAWGAVPSYFTS